MALRRDAMSLRGMARATLGLVLGGIGISAWAIEPGDQLPHGQDLVEQATYRIDAWAASTRGVVGDRGRLFTSVRKLIAWEDRFARDTVAVRYPLDGSDGLLVRDGIADTIATRLSGLLAGYASRFPDEILTEGRQTLELTMDRFPVPPGRFLGFHLVHLAGMIGAQCDTILAVQQRLDRIDAAGVQDGYLRHLWDLGQLYAQAHISAGERYLCTITQEDWIAQRMVCPKCAKRGLKFYNQKNGMNEDTTEVCRKILDVSGSNPESALDRIRCRHWGHIFFARCPACSTEVRFSVPLPHYRQMLIEIELGKEKAPDMQERIRKI
jgi:hypothetical protein